MGWPKNVNISPGTWKAVLQDEDNRRAIYQWIEDNLQIGRGRSRALRYTLGDLGIALYDLNQQGKISPPLRLTIKDVMIYRYMIRRHFRNKPDDQATIEKAITQAFQHGDKIQFTHYDRPWESPQAARDSQQGITNLHISSKTDRNPRLDP